MSRALRYLMQALCALVMVTASLAGASVHAAATASAGDSGETALLGEGSCGDEGGGDEIVLCGNELLTGRVDASLLRMPANQCSALLDELFESLSCRPGDGDCDRAIPASPGPQVPQAVPTGSGGAIIADGDGLASDPLSVRLQSRDSAEPSPLDATPPVPPPRSPAV